MTKKKPYVKKYLFSRYWADMKRKQKPTPRAKPKSPFTMVTDRLLECQVTAASVFRNFAVFPCAVVLVHGVLANHNEFGIIWEFPMILGYFFMWGFILFVVGGLIFFPAMPPIYFDRERQIIYTWRKDVVTATHFKYLHVNQDYLTVQLHMLTEDNKNQGHYKDACVASKASSYDLRGKFLDQDFFGTIVAFMEEGKGALITGDSYKGKVPIWDRFIFSIKKPDNFEERLDKLLAYQQSLFDEKENVSAKVD